ncbi:putative disease resistance RPP13-like protein 1 [Impatiens glandulifera]|uniref:putative disease resistance RPP13-like protein 1 n=1 Tax=Impatiens glandulifera TaxID=253017 RepID=UPI001FB0AA9B|nr:putative disease resistance RPP13-like protein 1 [Impatiens glandulifera]
MVLWEAVLSPALQVLFDKLSSGDLRKFLETCKVQELLIEKLKIAYFTNTAVVDDAEEKQYHNPAIETWLHMLKVSVYEAEDILDELATEALRHKQQQQQQHYSTGNQVRNWSFTSLNPFVNGVNSKIEYLVEKLEYIAKQKDGLGLNSGGRGGLSQSGFSWRTPSTPLLIESHVYGREAAKEEIIPLLCEDHQVVDGSSTTTSTAGFAVVPIIGMGRIGKTTLAKIVYNDRRIDDYFDVKAWAWVSDSFDVTSVTRTLVESVTGKPSNTTNLELLQSSLRRELNKKKFLIVLDDVWNENYDKWSELVTPFAVGKQHSKIIVTTRNKEVLSIMNSIDHPYQLKEMSDNSCLSLFQQHAFRSRNPNAYPELQAIGTEMAYKCKGLPLAVKTLGGLLASKPDVNWWRGILRSNLWDLPQHKDAILPALRLSYHHLPMNLKRCFAYCSIFPKGCEFHRKTLVLLWMAEGFIQQSGNLESLEDLGNEYFDNLLSRSFFQESLHSQSMYVMHDLINDLAHSISRKMCIRLEDPSSSSWSSRQPEFSENARHFSYIRTKYDVFKRFESLYNVKKLRTFLSFPPRSVSEVCYLTKVVPNDILPKLRCLRVLSLNGYCIKELPDTICGLKQLRYLDLSCTEIEKLPKSFCTLYNLQTLILCECSFLIELPADLAVLVNLQHLDITGSGIEKMPTRIENLTNLRTLSDFIIGTSKGELVVDADGFRIGEAVGGATGSGISDLRKLSNLQGKLSISGLENVVTALDAKRARLENKIGINELMFVWGSSLNESRNELIELVVLEMLQPHKEIQRLTIENFGGLGFPTWIGDPSFSKLVYLNLIDCQRCIRIPSVGQLPFLKSLFIKGMTGIKSIGTELYGYHSQPFPLLETLSFEDMLEWEEWSTPSEVEGFPNLSQLCILRCPKLQGQLPNHLSQLSKLVLNGIQRMSSSLPRLPLLHELEVKECDQGIFSGELDFRNLVTLRMHSVSNLTWLHGGMVRSLTRVEQLAIVDCPRLAFLSNEEVGFEHLHCLKQLVVQNCPLLVFLFEEKDMPGKLEYLELDSCHSLKKLPKEFHKLTSLQELTIKDCPRLKSFSETDFPSQLRSITIRGCNWESIPASLITNCPSLENVYISGCYSLISFPDGDRKTPTTFKHLSIDLCPSLESLPKGMMLASNSSLEVLEIFDCSSIVSFPKGQLPVTLKNLNLWNCAKLESLKGVMTLALSLESFRIGNCIKLQFLPDSLHGFVNLEYFEIDECPSLVSFPQEGLPINLKTVHIGNCENLLALPKRMQHLTSLQELEIFDCPSIVCFPEGGFPINLLSLEIKGCANLKPLPDWGLERLCSLRKFSIYGACLDLTYFPDWLLPSTLTTLHIGRLPNLTSLSDCLCNLVSLEELKIKECPELAHLPNEGLPATLSYLEISSCALLERHCETNMAKIDHIPCIVM